MQETLSDHHTSISTGGRPMCNLWFANDIEPMEGSDGELQDLTKGIVEIAAACGMEVSTEKSKTMTNSTNNISSDISMICQKLEDIASVRYLGATLCKDTTCSAEIHIRIASAMAAMVRLNRIWRSNAISFAGKFKLHKSLVISILLYDC